MHLPQTYFDILIQKDEYLLKSVEKDIISLDGQGPFGSLDDYSNCFNDYFESLTAKIIEDVLLQLGTVNRDSIINEIKHSEEYRSLFVAAHSDYLTLTNFLLFGKKTFYISSNLAEHLSQTSLEVDSDFIELPFKTCLFVYDDETTINALNALDGNKNNVVLGIPISVFCTSRFTEKGEKKIIFACWQANRQRNNIFIKRELLLRKGWKVSEILKTEWTEIYNSVESPEQHGRQKDDTIFYNEGLLFFRIILNTILYLSSADKDTKEALSPHETLYKQLSSIKKIAKKKKARKKLSKISRLNFIDVGRDVEAVISKSTGQSFSNINKRFIVRGHWRNQPFGPGLSERKLIFVQPYYKGPELAELINKPYRLK